MLATIYLFVHCRYNKIMCHEKVSVTTLLMPLILTLAYLGHAEKSPLFHKLNQECQIIVEKQVQKTGR